MATRIRVRVENAELVAKKLRDLTTEIPRLSRGEIYGRMIAARKRITKYPPPFRGSQPFVSDKQRRFFFYALHAGIIRVPYQRTGTYLSAWSITKTKDGYDLSGNASQNGRDYTKWVGGDAAGRSQARIHRGRWANARQVVDSEVEKLPPQIVTTVTSAARRHGFYTR